MSTFRSQLRDKPRHSSAAQSPNMGGARKGGAGGKGSWGKPGDELKYVYDRLDKDDPMYDPMDAEDDSYLLVAVDPEPEPAARRKFAASLEEFARFKKALGEAVEEWFDSDDLPELLKNLEEIDMIVFHQEIPSVIVRRAITKGSDKFADKVDGLLMYLHKNGVVTPQQMEQSFRHLFDRLPDMVLDEPKAFEQLKRYVKLATTGEYLDQVVADNLVTGAKAMSDKEVVKRVKAEVKAALLEYYESEDLSEFARIIGEQKAPHFHHEWVKQAVSTSLDRSDRERELVSVMLASLAHNTLQAVEIEKGFQILLGRVEDLAVDVPKVLQYLSCFLARAIVDEALPPAFLARVSVVKGDMGYEIVQQTESLLKTSHAHVRLAKVWGTRRSVVEMKKAVRDLIKEYFNSSDASEAARCVKELPASFYHEVVKRVVMLSLDRKDSEADLAIALLTTLSGNGTISAQQLRLGLARIEAELDDRVLDSPNAKNVFARFVKALKNE
eukprot:TRINITY_DN51508_c0_g2_i1.p1 TRINITY_DN51508_c0_g2~~TRINITY_DN51508_c0_g2_i1.p1  ORF type:complete len:498 (+),score=299.88 TRINITY_DN51508_c0_g2_i1:41-1534(+)